MAFPVYAAQGGVTPYLSADSSEYAAVQAAIQAMDPEILKNDIGEKFALDPDSIMPMYHADLADFLETGTLTVERKQLDGNDTYITLATNEAGDFVGEVRFSLNGSNGEIILGDYGYSRRDTVTETLDFATHEEQLRRSLAEKAGNLQIESIKVLWFDGIGYALLTETAGHDLYVTTYGAQQANSPLLPDDAAQLPGVDNAAETIATYTPKEIKKAAEQRFCLAEEPNILLVIGSAAGGLIVGAGLTAIILRRRKAVN